MIGAGREAVVRAIRDARTRAGLTQEKAAALRSHATSTISRWETGGMPNNWDDLNEYAHALGQPITLHFGPQTKEAPPPQWATGLVEDVPAIRADVERVATELAILRALLEARQSGLLPPGDDPVDDPPLAQTTRKLGQ